MRKWDQVEGFFYNLHREEYERLISLIPDKSTMVEVGCFRGRSLCSVADLLVKKKIQVLAIDMFDNVTYTYDESHVISRRKGMASDFQDNIEEFGLKEQVTSYTMSSVAAATLLAPRASLIFLDAAHDYTSVKADIDAWGPLVLKGGILCGHDYAEYCPGVIKAVNERCRKFEVHNEIWSATKE